MHIPVHLTFHNAACTKHDYTVTNASDCNKKKKREGVYIKIEYTPFLDMHNMKYLSINILHS